jgi:Tfp pilus assembly protein PilF
MSISRLEKLFQYYKEDPDDPFNIYAIALEYVSQKNSEAKIYFDLLLEKKPSYLPAYFHAAKFYASAGDRGKAEKIYKSGITLAQQNNEQHALRELRNAFNNFLFEEEEED